MDEEAIVQTARLFAERGRKRGSTVDLCCKQLTANMGTQGASMATSDTIRSSWTSTETAAVQPLPESCSALQRVARPGRQRSPWQCHQLRGPCLGAKLHEAVQALSQTLWPGLLLLGVAGPGDR